MAKRRSKGEGSIFKEASTGYWCGKITLPNGDTKRKRSKSQQVVREWLLEQRKALQENLLLKDEQITLGEYLDRFMEDVVEHTLAPTTVHSYRYLIADHIQPKIGYIKLVNLRPHHLQALYSEKLDAGLSKRTVQYIHSVIRRSLNQALKWGLIYRNPTDAVTPPRPKRKAPTTLTVDEVRQFLDSVEDHRWYPIYLLAITTGMRKGEILGLHWEDVDLEKNTISIKRSLVTIQGRSMMSQPKSDASRRTIALPEMVSETLKEYQLVTGKDDGLVFTTSTDQPISQRNLTRHFHAALSKVGLQKIRFHDLRHTAATLLLQAKVHPKVVQEMLGHSTIVLTLDTYSHVIPGIQEKAASEMDRILG